MTARRRTTTRRRSSRSRKPSVGRRLGGWLLGEVSGRHTREALERRFETQRKQQAEEAKAARAKRADVRADRREARSERLHELRVTREMRAAAILWHRQEMMQARVEAERAKAERARTATTRQAATSKAKTAEAKANEYADLLKQAEAGTLTGDKLAYFLNTYGQSGKKRRT